MTAVCHEEFLDDAEATERLGARLAALIEPPMVIFLHGELGAGKTTLVRGLLHALGHKGPVKSPTFTLVEPYRLAGVDVYHFDLYRLSDPEELDYLGARDYFSSASLCLIEWPEQGRGWLPEADLQLRLEYRDDGRHAILCAVGARGAALLENL